MNYSTGLLAFLLIYVPMFFVYRDLKRKNERADREYREFIRKHYGRSIC